MHLDYVRRAMPGWLTRDQLDSGLLAEYLFPTLTGRLVEAYLNKVFFRKLFCFILLSANWERKLPIWIVLMVNSLTKSDIASRGFPVLDLHLSQLATRKRKVVGAIEEVGRLIFIISHDLYFLLTSYCASLLFGKNILIIRVEFIQNYVDFLMLFRGEPFSPGLKHSLDRWLIGFELQLITCF